MLYAPCPPDLFMLRIIHDELIADVLYFYKYTGCTRRNGPDFGRVFLMLNYIEKSQNTYIQS